MSQGTEGGSLPLCLADAQKLWEAVEAYAGMRYEIGRSSYVQAMAAGTVGRCIRAREHVLDLIHGKSETPVEDPIEYARRSVG